MKAKRQYNVAKIKRVDEEHTVVGSGVIYFEKEWRDHLYLITAAHCLYEDGDGFTYPFSSIIIDVYSPSLKIYVEQTIELNKENTFRGDSIDEDIAIVKLPKSIMEEINPELTELQLLVVHPSIKKLCVYGYPLSRNHELQMSTAIWCEHVIGKNKFEASLDIDISEYYASGFSGGAVFMDLCVNEHLLLGIFTRYTKDERGRIVVSQSFERLNEYLEWKQWPKVQLSYLVEGDLTQGRVKAYNQQMIKNLGPNYNPEINVETDIYQNIHAVLRNNAFYEYIIREFNDWRGREHFYDHEKDSIVGKKEQEYLVLCSELAQFMARIERRVDKQICLENVIQKVSNFQLELKQIRLELEETSRLCTKDKERKELENQVSRIYTLVYLCDSFLSFAENKLIKIANNPIVIIEGEAGCGKSHLLGDIASRSLQEQKLSLLFLAREFDGNDTIQNNILKLLGIECPFDMFLKSLNDIAIQQNERVLLLIDAINETEKTNLWKNNLPGFIQQISTYPGIGLIITIRSTYAREVIPNTLKQDEEMHIILHNGFRGREYDAIQRFCRYYGLEAPKMPVLNPEYSNPLFLHISCRVASEKPEKRFDWANKGIVGLFTDYRKSLDCQYNDKLDRTYYGRKVVSTFVRILAQYMYENNVYRVDYDTCENLVRSKWSDCPYLLRDLIGDCLLKKDGYSSDETEYISFTYQRMSDFFMADYLLEGCVTAIDVQTKFKETTFRDFFERNINRHGIIEQLAILLPEKYDLEYWEVVNEEAIYADPGKILLDSLKWRGPEHVDETKIVEFLRKGVDYYDWLNTLVMLASIPNHPFNADRWHRIMMAATMAERDKFLQFFLLNYYQPDSNFPDKNITRLIDWAWEPGIGKTVNAESARLIGIILLWFTSSTINSLRDKATKAAVNMLQYHSQSLLAILNLFKDVDDWYVRERLYAVAYGCILRTKDFSDKRAIGKCVYEQVFGSNKPPRHLLLRDYACCTVEYAVRECGLEGVELQKVLPPYGEEVPIYPDDTFAKQLKAECDKDERRRAIATYYLLGSLVSGLSDFGDKILKPHVEEFCPGNFKIEAEYKGVRNKTRGEKRKLLDTYEKELKQKKKLTKDTFPWQVLLQSDLKQRKIKKQVIDSEIIKTERSILTLFGEDLGERLIHMYVPNHMLMADSKYSTRPNVEGAKHWVLRRVYDLGFSEDLHGEYDAYVKRVEGWGRSIVGAEGRTERIGKKYEWIAHWELLGCLADNFQIEAPWNTIEHMVYDGAWQNYWRDIDPCCVTRRVDNEIKWPEYDSFPCWHIEGEKWLDRLLTIEQIRQILERHDTDAKEWLTLRDANSISEPMRISMDRWHSATRYYSIYIHAFIVQKKDKTRLIEIYKNKPLNKYDYEWDLECHTSLIMREKFWSRAMMVEKRFGTPKWVPLYRGCPIKVMHLYETMGGNIEGDCSGVDSSYYMPTQEIIETLKLEYVDEDGMMKNQDGSVIVCSNPLRTCHLMMRKDSLLQYLQSNEWDLIWIVETNKMYSMSCDEYGKLLPSSPCGLFYYNENGTIVGDMIMNK